MLGSENENVFNPAHPPLMVDSDKLPPAESGSELIGSPFVIEKQSFALVYDPKYPWQDMPHSSPEQWRKWKDTKEKKLEEVEQYLVLRERFWKMIDRKMFSDDIEQEVIYEVGVNFLHEEVTEEMRTQKIGAELGLTLSGSLTNPQAPPSNELIAAEEGGGKNDPKVGGSLKLTWEMSHMLKFSKQDTASYSRKETRREKSTRKGGFQYLIWQLQERLLLFRIIGGHKTPALDGRVKLKQVEATTEMIYPDRFNMDKKRGE